MKVAFDSQGNNYVEIRIGGTPGKYQLVISAQDPKNPLTTIVNSVELTQEQLSTLISDLGLNLSIVDNKG
jgi:hypothetical protein